MNRRLMIMRHAHSSRENPSLADHDRPLDERGLGDSPIVAKEILSAAKLDLEILSLQEENELSVLKST